MGKTCKECKFFHIDKEHDWRGSCECHPEPMIRHDWNCNHFENRLDWHLCNFCGNEYKEERTDNKAMFFNGIVTGKICEECQKIDEKTLWKMTVAIKSERIRREKEDG